MHQKKNLTGLTTVILLHVLLLAAFLRGSTLTVFKPAPSVVDLVPTVEQPEPKLQPPQVDMPPPRQPDIFVPQVDAPAQTEPTVTARPLPEMFRTPEPDSITGRAEPGAKTPQAAHAPVVTAAVVDAQACSKPDYPKNALRNGDTGTVMLAFLIGTDGKVADARIEKSSGFRELDRAAQAGLSLCKFKPGTVDGMPQQSWTKMQYVWSLD